MKVLLISLIGLMITGCIHSPPAPKNTPLQMREIQSREFSTTDEIMVMKAVLNVLQDEGFIAKNAVSDLGLISATKETDVSSRADQIWETLFSGPEARWPMVDIVEATANVSPFGNSTRVRISFHQRVVDNRGATMSTFEITDAVKYRDFFSKVDKGVFIEKQRI